jgi:hypothetical protein
MSASLLIAALLSVGCHRATFVWDGLRFEKRSPVARKRRAPGLGSRMWVVGVQKPDALALMGEFA